MAKDLELPASISDNDTSEEAYSHWLDLAGGNSRENIRTSSSPLNTIEDHAKLNIAAMHSPTGVVDSPEISGPTQDEKRPEEKGLGEPEEVLTQSSRDAAQDAPTVVSQSDVDMLRGALDAQSRILTGLRLEIEKSAKRKPLWVWRGVFLILIAVAFWQTPDSLMVLIDEFWQKIIVALR